MLIENKHNAFDKFTKADRIHIDKSAIFGLRFAMLKARLRAVRNEYEVLKVINKRYNFEQSTVNDFAEFVNATFVSNAEKTRNIDTKTHLHKRKNPLLHAIKTLFLPAVISDSDIILYALNKKFNFGLKLNYANAKYKGIGTRKEYLRYYMQVIGKYPGIASDTLTQRQLNAMLSIAYTNPDKVGSGKTYDFDYFKEHYND